MDLLILPLHHLFTYGNFPLYFLHGMIFEPQWSELGLFFTMVGLKSGILSAMIILWLENFENKTQVLICSVDLCFLWGHDISTYCFALAFYKHSRHVHCTQHNTLPVSWDNKSLGILPMIIIQLDLTKNVPISNYFIFQSLLPYFSINETLTVVKTQNQKLSLSSVAWLFVGSMKVSH